MHWASGSGILNVIALSGKPLNQKILHTVEHIYLIWSALKSVNTIKSANLASPIIELVPVWPSCTHNGEQVRHH